MLNGARVSGLYSIEGVDWLIADEVNFSSATALKLAEFEELHSNKTMGLTNAKPMQYVRVKHQERKKDERQKNFEEASTKRTACEDMNNKERRQLASGKKGRTRRRQKMIIASLH